MRSTEREGEKGRKKWAVRAAAMCGVDFVRVVCADVLHDLRGSQRLTPLSTPTHDSKDTVRRRDGGVQWGKEADGTVHGSGIEDV